MIWGLLAKWRCRALDRQLARPMATQQQALRRALAQVGGCRIARDLGLQGQEDIVAFRRSVPVTDYQFYQPYVDAALAGQPSILFQGTPLRIAQTGGTTGRPKRLPLNRALIQSYRQFNLDMVFRYMTESGRYDILNDRFFVVAANPAEERTANDVPIGYITGIMADIAPGLLKRRYVPGIDVIRNPDMGEKIRQICEIAYRHRGRVRAAFGLTPYLMSSWANLVEYAERQDGRNRNISDIFPQLRVAFHGGTTFDLYRQRMQRMSGPGVAHRNVYSAAEGPIASQLTSDHPGLVPALSGVFFEFIPDDQAGAAVPDTLLIDEVEAGKTFYLVMTTQGGLLRYRIGDRIRFTETRPPLFVVLGKPEDQIDLSAEKIGVQQASEVLAEAATAMGVRISDFLVCPVAGTLENVQLAHEWILESEPEPDAEQFAEELERRLSQRNPMYQQLREHDFSLGPPRLTFVPSGTFHRYLLSELRFGQQKMLHMHNDRQVADRVLRHARPH